MLKSGLIFAAIALVLAIGSAVIISPLCVPCLALFLGLGAGYVAGMFDMPADNAATIKAGALAGAIGGAGGLLGQLIASAINAVLVGPEGAMQLMRQLGIDPGAAGAQGYWGGLIGGTCCFGLLDVALMAGLGALGGLLWWQLVGQKAVAVVPPQPPL